MTAKWPGHAWTIAPLPTIPMVGAGAEETQEAEETEEAEPFCNSLEAWLDRAMAEPDHERQEVSQCLKEFRRKKRLNRWIGRQEQARAEMRAEMYSVLHEGAEKTVSGGFDTLRPHQLSENIYRGLVGRLWESQNPTKLLAQRLTSRAKRGNRKCPDASSITFTWQM